MLIFHRLDGEDEEIPIQLKDKDLFLGRGALLKIDATNISRKKAKVCLEEGKAVITCTHRVPLKYITEAGDAGELKENEKRELISGDIIKFSDDKYLFQVSTLGEGTVDTAASPLRETGSPLAPTVRTPNNNLENSNTAGPATPVTAGKQNAAAAARSAKKPRVLPAWMTALASTDKENSPPQPAVEAMDTSEPEPSTSAMADHAVSNAADDVVPMRDDVVLGRRDDVVSMRDDVVPMRDDVVPMRDEGAGGSNGATSNDVQDTDNNRQQTKQKQSGRPVCSYGSGCYRKNPRHFEQESHPGDDDYQLDQQDEDDDRPECEYGMDCYRKNPDHRKQFKHTKKPQPKRRAKQAKKNDDDEYESDFIDDESDGWEPLDDTDEDEDWELPPDED